MLPLYAVPLLLLFLFTARPCAAQPAPWFEDDLAALTQSPHRLAGSPQGLAATVYVEQRLRDLGIDTVLPLSFPVWYLPQERNTASLEIQGRTVPLLPLRPNILAPAVTPADGLTGPLRYLGRGTARDFAEHDVRDALAVLDYDAPADAWHRAFEAGAAAVLFRGTGEETTPAVKHASVPINLPRFYLPADPATGLSAGIDLTRDQPAATLHARGAWQRGAGRNLVAVIPGREPDTPSAPDLRREVVVVAASIDSFGAVPHRSPGARSAANAALLLHAAERWIKHPPRRTVVLLFVDGQAQGQLGARHLYDALGMTDAQHATLQQSHLDARVQWKRWKDTLRSAAKNRWSNPLPHALQALMARHADWLRADVARTVRLRRLQLPRDPKSWSDADRAAVDKLNTQAQRWDALRRTLHEGKPLAQAPGPDLPVEQLLTDVQQRIDDRLAELNDALRIDGQRDALRSAIAAPPNGDIPATIKLHVTLDLAGDGPTWGLFVGDRSDKIAAAQSATPEADAPGYYQALLAHLNAALADPATTHAAATNAAAPDAPATPHAPPANLATTTDPSAPPANSTRSSRAPWPLLERQTLRDPDAGRRLVPGRFVNSGSIAGSYGVFNLAAMTCHDARPRDGHPADTPDALNTQNLLAQGREALALLDAAINRPGLPSRPSFKPRAVSTYVTGTAENPLGPSAQQRVAGGLSENRPARHAMVALWSSKEGDAGKSEAWQTLGDGATNSYEPARLIPVDAQGRFAIIGAHRDIEEHVITLGVTTDTTGRVTEISNAATLNAPVASAIRTDLIAATPGHLAFRPHSATAPQGFGLLLAGSDTTPRPTDALVGQAEPFSFFYLATHLTRQRIRIFQPGGPVLLGNHADAQPGYPFTHFAGAAAVIPQSAADLWTLDEARLDALRRRAIIRPDLESLHRDARPPTANADDAPLAEAPTPDTPTLETSTANTRADNTDTTNSRTNTTDNRNNAGNANNADARSRLAVSQRVYTPLRGALDDLVRGAVILLALTIPFAFALERLLVGAATVQGRVIGFAVIFLLTFLWLYLLHPGFAVAATPVIIFLAFAILLLSSLVIYMLLRKFQTELRAIQGQAVLAHRQQASHLATLAAAIQMGMSTMRRRPMRTFLTTLTVLVLTFTMLCFAGFDRLLGVSVTALGPAPSTAPADGLLLRSVNYQPLTPALRDLAAQSLRHHTAHDGAADATDSTNTETKTANADNNNRNSSDTDTADATVAAAYWLTGNAIPVARADDGAVSMVRGIVGYTPAAVGRWPALAAALGSSPTQNKAAELAGNGVFLPPRLTQDLNLAVGDTLLINGYRARLAGILDLGRLTRLRHLDGRSVLPVDLLDAAARAAGSGGSATSSGNATVEFQYLGATQVVVAGEALVRRLGGELHTLTVFPGSEAATQTVADRLSRAATVPVWSVGAFGLERRVLTTLTRITGLGAVIVPLLLGGLIVFGTLLGSITDRKQEIYTFSALGLGPGHIGALFFAEAAVYAVVGGLGGQMLAQLASAVFNALAQRGLAEPLGINYASGNALFAMAVVMLTVLVSAIYPARRAARSANPGVARTWAIPKPDGDDLQLRFPFTVSAYDMTGVAAFLAEHFRSHDDAGLGHFAASDVHVCRDPQQQLEIAAHIATAPFDLGVTQHVTLTATASAIPGVDEVQVHIRRRSGTPGDWTRTNRVFLRDLRRQFLLWRTLDATQVQRYRQQTLETLGSTPPTPPPTPTNPQTSTQQTNP